MYSTGVTNMLGLVRFSLFLVGINPGESYLYHLLKHSWQDWFQGVIPCEPNSDPRLALKPVPHGVNWHNCYFEQGVTNMLILS
jgi:hypothetical protein